MKTVGAYEAKTHLPRLLDEVEKGATITITKHGKPVAVLSPPPPARPDARVAIEAWRKYREEQNIRLGPGLTIRQLIEEGRP
jgi:prevent-host-death family protein